MDRLTHLLDQPVTLGRAEGPYGEVVLRRRGEVEELVVDGSFAMDSAEVSSEVALGRFAVGAARVLVGGLGLGYTVASVLDDADRTGSLARVDVVELEPTLVAWAESGLTRTLARVAADPRVRLHVADVSQVLTGAAPAPLGPWEAILLDVDNGPDFVLHADNAALYDEGSLRTAYEQLLPGGTLAIWCQGPSPDLLATLRRIGPAVTEHLHHVQRGQRRFAYAICTLTR